MPLGRIDAAPDSPTPPPPRDAGDEMPPPPPPIDGSSGPPDVAVAEAGADGPPYCKLAQTCTPGGPCPDLVIEQQLLTQSVYVDKMTFASNSCEFFEGCIDYPGQRTLLHFAVGVANLGNGDLTLGSPINNSCFVYSTCHMHYHFYYFAQYILYEADGVTVATMGHKQSFCIDDTGADPYDNDAGPMPPFYFDCTNMGIHVGYYDVYPVDKPCQWVDVTGIPPGNYVLEVRINYAHILPESNYDNDVVRVNVTIPGNPPIADAGPG
jgi:hypothetical protein